MAEKIKRASFSLEDEYQKLFEEIVNKTRRTRTEELRLMLDARAAGLGLEPVRPVDPKSSPSVREMALAQIEVRHNGGKQSAD